MKFSFGNNESMGKSKVVVIGALMACTLGMATSNASIVAIVDTGVDLNHKIFTNRAWANALEVAGNALDEDQNGMADDVTGWSFVDGTAKSFDRSWFDGLSDDVYKFQEIMEKVQSGDVNSEELSWFRASTRNKELMAAFSFYMGVSHGTHVAGISVKGNNQTKVMSVKYLGPANKEAEEKKENLTDDTGSTGNSDTDQPVVAPLFADRPMEDVWPVIAASLGQFAQQEGEGFATMATYVQRQGDVVNGSFGSSPLSPEVYQVFAGFFYRLTGRLPTNEEYARMANYFYNLESGYVKQALDKSNTLFVFAAGNETSDNDLIPCSPANHGSDNAVTVAATVGRSALADFSNFGATKVDVAAPGSDILSSAPGKRSFLRMSGTSQAAPYVTNTALKMIDANPAYFNKNLAQRAKLLKMLIVGTVDKKDWLVGKVSSAGVVNQQRAVAAARLLGSVSVEQAIAGAHAQVADLADATDLHATSEWANLGLKPFVSKISPSFSAEVEIKVVQPEAGKGYPQI